MRSISKALLLLICSSPVLFGQTAQEPFELKDGDRVALIGGTFIEREQRYGFIELALTTRWPDRRIIFRNLGWSGDDVTGESRLYFGTYRGTTTRQEGLDHLFKTLELFHPTVAFVAYGSNEAFEGAAGLAKFVEGYKRLLERLEKTGARIVLLSPIKQENLGPPFPDPTERNKNLELYSAAIRQLAVAKNSRFVDLFHGLEKFKRPGLLQTDNGMHLTEPGYLSAAMAIEAGLGLAISRRAESAGGSKGRVRLSPEAEALRQLIIEKDRFFFHRYRPQNDTYLRGFREYEQGNNAVEIPQFDPLVEEKDLQIHEMKRRLPKGLVYLPAGMRGSSR
jgi:lysophospholipase L1-like esterase